MGSELEFVCLLQSEQCWECMCRVMSGVSGHRSGEQLLLFPESWTSSQVGLELEFVCLPAVGAMPRMYGRSNERGERPSKW